MAEGGVQFRLRRHELVDEGALHGLVQRRVLVHAVEDAAQLGLFGVGQIAAHHDGPCRSRRQDGEDPDLFAQLRIPPVYEVVNLAVDAGRVGQVVGDGPNGFIVVIGVKGRFEIGRSRRIHVQQKKVDGLPARIAEGIRKGEDPALQLRMITANTQELFRLMDQGELDFAIVEGSFDQQVYEGLVYCTQRFIPVAAPDYSFSGPVHRMADLLEARLLIREPGSGTRGVLERALESCNLTVQDFRYLTELGSLNLIKSLVCAGAGISFFYQPVVQAELDRGELVEIHLEEGDIRHDFTFLWRRGSAFAPYYREMFRLLRQP